MSMTPTASIDACVLADESTGATGAGPPELVASAPAPESQHAVQDEPPRPKYLDPEWMKEGVPDTKFYKDYPPDAWGEEASPNARVWKIYRDDGTTADAATLKSWNSTIDVLLIFAGLFSAVSTAFIVESYKSLQPDYTQYIAKFLYAAATNSSAASGGVMMFPTVASMGPPDSFVHPSATSRWTNGLWFTSLVISLTVALLCILVKQWLDEYHGRITRSAPSFRAWARRHQLYYRGLNTWGVPVLISLLPLLLHISLFLFCAGLVLFLRPLDGAIANMLLAILAFVLLFYVLALVVPALRVECPSYTPLLAQARFVIVFGLAQLDYASESLSRFIYHHFIYDINTRLFVDLNSVIARLYHRTTVASERLLELLARTKQPFARETTAIDAQKFELDGWAFTTLLTSTNEADIIDAGTEAIGAISAEPTLEIVVRNVRDNIIDDRIYGDPGILPVDTGSTSSARTVITNARRVRAFWSLTLTRTRLQGGCEHRLRPTADLYHVLGVDGTIIQLISADWLILPNRRRDLYLPIATLLRERLTAYLLAEEIDPSGVDARTGIPTRAMCLLFLSLLASPGMIHLWQHQIPCVLLTFCAGNFAQADSYEQGLALRAVYVALKHETRVLTALPVAAPSGHGDEVALDTLNCLYFMLASHEACRANDGTARLFARHLGLVSESMCRSLAIPDSLRWAQLTGFAVFVMSPDSAQYISHTGLEGYIALLERVDVSSCEDREPFLQYCGCVATLLNLSCNLEAAVQYLAMGGPRARPQGREFID